MASSTTTAPLLTEAKAKKYTAITESYIHEFCTSAVPADAFLAGFAEDVHWYDHAFQVVRVGRPAILGLRKGFLYCNQPFEAVVKAIYPTPTGSVVEQLWKGRCVNDIVRPDGQVAVKGTGKAFETHVCMVLRINARDEIERIDEYYHKFWDEGRNEGQYATITGQSSRDVQE